MSSSSISYNRHRFPPETIAHTVWPYCRLNIGLCEVEEMFLDGVYILNYPKLS